MAKFKVVMTFPDGEVIDSYEEDGDDGIFDTEQEAEDYFSEWMSNYLYFPHLNKPSALVL